MRRKFLLLCLATLPGCAPTVQSYTLTQTYNEAEFTPFAGAGPASLNGQAFLKTVGGDVKTCAGNQVFLVPSTPYNDEVIAHTRVGEPLANRDSRATQFTRVSICDASGKFTFDRIPAKKWYVVTKVTWGVPSEYGINQQGGEVLQVVDLKNGVNQAILTDADRTHH